MAKKLQIVKPLIKSVLQQKIGQSNNKSTSTKCRIKPSELHLSCMRRLLYSYMRVEEVKSITPDLQKIFDIGHKYHDCIQEWLLNLEGFVPFLDKKTGEVNLDFMTGKPDPEFILKSQDLDIVYAKCDGVLIHKDKLWIIEIKSENNYKAVKRQAPDENHKTQANLYAFLLEEKLKSGEFDYIPKIKDFKEVFGIIYLYINKDNMRLKEFVKKKSLDNYTNSVNKIKKIQNFKESEILPEKDTNDCKYCPFIDKCKNDYSPFS